MLRWARSERVGRMEPSRVAMLPQTKIEEQATAIRVNWLERFSTSGAFGPG
jgi:hypothetical protein